MINNNWPQDLAEKFCDKLNSITLENVTPNKELVLRFLEMDPKQIRVVIVGQDPYPTLGVANGRAFAVNKGMKLPQSLKNIFKEIEEIQGFVKTDETLESWANQGVLMFNRTLTTIIGQPGAHKNIWADLTLELIQYLDKEINPTFVLWGNDAIDLEKSIKHSRIIKDAHPSPLSVRKRNKNTFKELKGIKW